MSRIRVSYANKLSKISIYCNRPKTINFRDTIKFYRSISELSPKTIVKFKIHRKHMLNDVHMFILDFICTKIKFVFSQK